MLMTMGEKDVDLSAIQGERIQELEGIEQDQSVEALRRVMQCGVSLEDQLFLRQLIHRAELLERDAQILKDLRNLASDDLGEYITDGLSKVASRLYRAKVEIHVLPIRRHREEDSDEGSSTLLMREIGDHLYCHLSPGWNAEDDLSKVRTLTAWICFTDEAFVPVLAEQE